MTPAQRDKFVRALAKHGLESKAAESAGVLVPDVSRARLADERFDDQCQHAMVKAVDEVEGKLRDLALKGENQGPSKPRKYNPKYLQMYLQAKRSEDFSPAKHQRKVGTRKDESPRAIIQNRATMTDDELLAKATELDRLAEC